MNKEGKIIEEAVKGRFYEAQDVDKYEHVITEEESVKMLKQALKAQRQDIEKEHKKEIQKLKNPTSVWVTA